jgi:hypothetical protein
MLTLDDVITIGLVGCDSHKSKVIITKLSN